MGIKGSALSGGGYVNQFPQVPKPISGDGFFSSQPYRIPHKGTLVNNIKLNATEFSGYLDNSAVWSVVPSNINGACDYFLGDMTCVYDSVNDRLFVFGVDSGTTPITVYTSYITLETGVVTSLGRAKLSANPTGFANIGCAAAWRQSETTGNFRLYFGDRVVEISDNDGSEISNTTRPAYPDYSSLHTSEDESVQFGYYQFSSSVAVIGMYVKGQFVKLGCVEALLSGPGFNGDAEYLFALPWGDKVKMIRQTAGNLGQGPKTYNRAEFDTWVKDLATYAGAL